MRQRASAKERGRAGRKPAANFRDARLCAVALRLTGRPCIGVGLRGVAEEQGPVALGAQDLGREHIAFPKADMAGLPISRGTRRCCCLRRF